MRWLRRIAIGLAVVAALWSAAWLAAEPVIEWRVAEAAKSLEARGVSFTHRDIDVGGFPFRFDVTVSDPAVAAEARGATAALDGVTASVSVFEPTVVTVLAPEQIRVTFVAGEARRRVTMDLEAGVAVIRRVASGAYEVDAAVDTLVVQADDAGREVTATIRDATARASLQRRGESISGAFGVATIDGALTERATTTTETKTEGDGGAAAAAAEPEAIQVVVETLAGEFSAAATGFRVDGGVDKVGATRSGAESGAMESRSVVFDAALSPTGPIDLATALAALRADPGGAAQTLKSLIADVLEADGDAALSVSAETTAARTDMPPSAAPMKSAAVEIANAGLRAEVSRDASVLRATTSRIDYRIRSVSDVATDGAAESASLMLRAPLEAAAEDDARASLNAYLGPFSLTPETEARLYPEGGAAAHGPQELRVAALATLETTGNLLLTRLRGAPTRANVQEAELSALEASLLDLSALAMGKMTGAGDQRVGVADVTLTRWRPFFQRFAKTEIFDAALLNFVALAVGALSKPDPDDPDISRLKLELREGRLFLNGRELRR